MRGGQTRPQVKVFGTWFDLKNTAKIQPIEQVEEGDDDREEDEGATGEGGVDEGVDLVLPERLTLMSMGTAKWDASACCIVVDARLSGAATGGREPRIISLAASHVSGGKVLDSWHQYIKIDQSADAATVRGVHGLDFLTLQERASDAFKEVGSRWISWLRTRLGSAKAAACACHRWDSDAD